MRILLTGHKGFIGSALYKRLEEIKRFRGHRHPHRPDRGDMPDRRIWQRNGTE